MSLTLAQLEPELVRLIPGERQTSEKVDALADAHGGGAGTHMVLCWFRDRGVPADVTPGPARWAVSGAGLADLTLSPSIQLLGGCNWHGFVRGGVIEG